jgi:hypothetical protein
LRHYATNRNVVGSIPGETIEILNWPKPSSRTIALGSTQPLTEISTKNLPGGKGWPVRKAGNLTTLWASTARYGNNFTFFTSIRWKWVISFTSRSLCRLGKRTRYPFDRRLGGTQSRYGRCGVEGSLVLAGIEHGTSSP